MSDLRPNCQDCGAAIGEPHDDGCDTARCLAHGTQRLQCGDGTRLVVADIAELGVVIGEMRDGHDCGRDIWTGIWPGVEDAERLGWYAYFVPNGDPSWVPCGPDHPGAVADLNRLQIDGRWDAEALRWVAR